MKRNISRIKAMMMLYCYDLTGSFLDKDIFDNLIREESEEAFESDEEFVDTLVNGVISNIDKIDKVINLNIKNYSLDRLSYVDRNLIRIAVYEMLYTKTPINIIINEILNITHEYSQLDDMKSSSFNNSLLDKISKSIAKDDK